MNLRQSVRLLLKSPGFTFVSVLTLTLGIGANTAIFSVVYAALLRPLPYWQPDRLVTLAESRRQNSSGGGSQSSYPDYLDWKLAAKSLQSFAGSSGDAFTLVAGGEPKNTFAAQVTPNFFSTLGVKPILGRDFVDADCDVKDDIPRVAILSHSLWRSEFGSDPHVAGRIIRLDGRPVTIVGVLPRDFEYAPSRSAPLWVPLHPGPDGAGRRSLRWLSVIARLAPGVSFDQARAEMEGITAQLSRAYPKENGSTFLVMGSLKDRIVGNIRPLLLVLLGAVGFVLLITCANVANLLITRSIGRRKEFAVRAALGASRTNLIGQLLTESLLLSTVGAGLGLLAARWGIDVLIAAIPEQQLQSMPYLRDAGINIAVLMFLGGVTLLTAFLFGLAPALATSQLTLNRALKDESRGGTSTVHARLRNSLVMTEIAISLVLLVGAGLVLQSLRALLHTDPGFDIHNVLTFAVNLPDASYPSEKTFPFRNPSAVRFEHEFTESLRNVPGIRAVGAASGIPANGGSGSIRFVVEGRPTALGKEDECNILGVNASYFPALRIPLVRGRIFTAQDSPEGLPTVVVSRAFVKAYFPNDNPIGKRIRFTFSAKTPFLQIVGVVGDMAEIDLAAPRPAIVYVPNDQMPSTYISYLVRTAGDPTAAVGAVRSALQKMDPQLPLIQPQTLEQVADQSPAVFLRRYPSYLIGAFAALALMLAMVGLYGLISYTIVQRTREIGIRMTLGAQARDILHLVLRHGLGATVAGIGIGIIAGLGLTRLLSSLLFGVTPTDWLTFAGVASLLLVVALAACVAPARRAMRVDPTVAMRHE